MIFRSLIRKSAAVVGAFLLASCGVAPIPRPAPPPPPAPPPAPAPAPLAADWRDWPIAAGDWSYRATDGGSLASFGVAGQPAQLMVRCDGATRRISVSRTLGGDTEPAAGQMTIRTTGGDMQWPVMPGSAPGGAASYAVATRAAVDGGFDRMIFSRGRFAVEVPGAAPIAVPAWAEVARVVEDCRG